MAIVVSHKGADFEEMSKAALRQAALADDLEVSRIHARHTVAVVVFQVYVVECCTTMSTASW